MNIYGILNINYFAYFISRQGKFIVNLIDFMCEDVEKEQPKSIYTKIE